jgi:putative transposase
VSDIPADLFITWGTPEYICSNNGPEFVATAVKGWISGVGAKAAFSEPGSP